MPCPYVPPKSGRTQNRRIVGANPCVRPVYKNLRIVGANPSVRPIALSGSYKGDTK